MKNTILLRSALSSVLLASALALAGCSGNAQEGAPPATEAQGALAPVAATTHGRVKLIGDALSQVPLRTEQRTEIEKLAADADARHESLRQAHQAVALAVADQVEKGAIDRASLQPKIDAAVAAANQSRPQDRAAFQRLHDLLDATQREAFANVLKDKMDAEHGHWRGNDTAKTDGADTSPHGGFGRMKQLAVDLKLTDDQISQIKDVMKAEFQQNHGAGMREMMKGREHLDSVMEDFKGSTFSVDKSAPAIDLEAKVSEGTDRFVDVATKVLPILTADQRTVAAQKIREHAASGNGMPF